MLSLGVSPGSTTTRLFVGMPPLATSPTGHPCMWNCTTSTLRRRGPPPQPVHPEHFPRVPEPALPLLFVAHGTRAAVSAFDRPAGTCMYAITPVVAAPTGASTALAPLPLSPRPFPLCWPLPPGHPAPALRFRTGSRFRLLWLLQLCVRVCVWVCVCVCVAV